MICFFLDASSIRASVRPSVGRFIGLSIHRAYVQNKENPCQRRLCSFLNASSYLCKSLNVRRSVILSVGQFVTLFIKNNENRPFSTIEDRRSRRSQVSSCHSSHDHSILQIFHREDALLASWAILPILSILLFSFALWLFFRIFCSLPTVCWGWKGTRHEANDASSYILWIVLACFGMFWHVLACFGMFWHSFRRKYRFYTFSKAWPTDRRTDRQKDKPSNREVYEAEKQRVSRVLTKA